MPDRSSVDKMPGDSTRDGRRGLQTRKGASSDRKMFWPIARGSKPFKYNSLFDVAWYLEKYADVANSKRGPFEDYVTGGARLGRMPNPLFDSAWYLRRYPDAMESGLNPLEHFVQIGAAAGYDPNPLFDTDWYLKQNPDVAAAHVNPLEHYLSFGAKEARDPHPLFSVAWYVAQVPESEGCALAHYLTKRSARGVDPHPLFMSDYYSRKAFPLASAADEEPLVHYLTVGAYQGLDPNPLFDSKWYLRTYPDVAALGMNPLLHYRLIGAPEGRYPSPDFDTAFYLATNPDVLASKVNPLGHYLRYGAAEGRRGTRATAFPIPKGDDPVTLASGWSPNVSTDRYSEWCRLNDPGEGVYALQRRQVVSLRWRPVISLIVPVYKVSVTHARALIESVKAQTYPDWQLCLALAWFDDRALTQYLEAEAADDPRIDLQVLKENGGIARNSNAALQHATGDYIGLVDHDDTLAPNALFEMASALDRDPSIDFLYSDKDTTDESGQYRVNPLFKPEWSPELMLSVNYLTHFNVLRTSRVREIGGWDPSTDGAQDWDLFLRFIGKTTKVHAVRRPLYHWRTVPTSVASGIAAKPWAAAAQLRVVSRYLDSGGWKGAAAKFAAENVIRVEWNAQYDPSILVLVVGQGAEPSGPAWQAFRLRAERRENNITIKYLNPAAADFSEAANACVARSAAEVIVFLEAASEPADRWIAELIGPLQNPDIAVVGGRFEDRAGRLIEGGWVFPDGRPAAIFKRETRDYYSVCAAAWWMRNHLAVSGALMAVRRRVWDLVGGFSVSPAWGRRDLDLCIRISGQTHRRIVLNTFARNTGSGRTMFEQSANRLADATLLFSKYFPDGDPFFHPKLTIVDGGRPAFRLPRQVRANDYTTESKYAATHFDAPAEAFARRLNGPPPLSIRRVAWFVPDFEMAFYGGIHTILRAADHMRARYQVHPIFVVLGAADSDAIRLKISRAFPDLAASCDIKIISSVDIPRDLVEADAAVATLWPTAYAILRLKNVHHRFYFMQDYEPLFYPGGSSYGVAEATYRLGFHGICNTEPLKKLYERNGGTADFFLPAVDTSVFHDRGRPKRDPSEPFLLFNYARPAHPRNCFEVVAEGLIELKRRMKSRVQIITAGAEWDPRDHGLSGIVEHVGLLPYRQTGDLYRAVDAGIVAMATAHPSYLPFELMACGAAVVTNRNANTTWLLKDRENCALFDLTRSSIADTVQAIFDDAAHLDRIQKGGVATIAKNHSDWNLACETIAATILRGSHGHDNR